MIPSVPISSNRAWAWWSGSLEKLYITSVMYGHHCISSFVLKHLEMEGSSQKRNIVRKRSVPVANCTGATKGCSPGEGPPKLDMTVDAVFYF